jgi:hypothetical protein
MLVNSQNGVESALAILQNKKEYQLSFSIPFYFHGMDGWTNQQSYLCNCAQLNDAKV